MSDGTIECPHCHKPFKLDETLAAPLVEETRRKFEREFDGRGPTHCFFPTRLAAV